MQKREINTGCNDASNGVAARPIDDVVVIDSGPAGVSEGEAYRVTLSLSWETLPADALTIGGVASVDVGLEEAEVGV